MQRYNSCEYWPTFELSNLKSSTNVVEVRQLWLREKLCVSYDTNREKKQYFFALLRSQTFHRYCVLRNFIITFRSVQFFSLTCFFVTWCLRSAIDCREKWMYNAYWKKNREFSLSCFYLQIWKRYFNSPNLILWFLLLNLKHL